MDASHQSLRLKRQNAFQTLQAYLAAEQLVVAKRHHCQQTLEDIDHQWCGVVVEQLVSDVLAFIASHLELAEDMRAFRLTCTHWNLSFCDNTQLFVDCSWRKPSAIGVCVDAHPLIESILQPYYHIQYISAHRVSLYYDTQGRLQRFEYNGVQFWLMKDGLWMETQGKRMRQIVPQDSVTCTGSKPLIRHIDYLQDAHECSGHTIEFWRSYTFMDTQAIHVDFHGKRHSTLRYDNPCQTNLLSIQQQVIDLIGAADCIQWKLGVDVMGRLHERIKGAVRSWRVAVVQRNNPKDFIL